MAYPRCGSANITKGAQTLTYEVKSIDPTVRRAGKRDTPVS